MAKIFYSMAGEGRGHASRVRSMVEQLRNEHELVLLASGQAFDFLTGCYGENTPNVEIRRIPGLRFKYTNNRLNVTKSVIEGFRFRYRLRDYVREVGQWIEQDRPRLAVVDFEPILPRAARRMNVPYIVVNHQNFAEAYKLSILPVSLKIHAAGIRWAVRQHHTRQTATVVSGFFKPPLHKGFEDVVQVGPLLRPEVRGKTPSDGDFLLSYLRPHTPAHVFELLKQCGKEVRIYGLGERPEDGPLTYRAISEETYVDDLASCRAYIGAAGNQTLGELLYFGKPVFALPEDTHHEQLINAHFIRHMGVGNFATAQQVDKEHFADFFVRRDDYLEKLAPLKGALDGTDATVEVIQRQLRKSDQASVAANPMISQVAAT
jgi:uncharacterized protein (TIGR00661 family)